MKTLLLSLAGLGLLTAQTKAQALQTQYTGSCQAIPAGKQVKAAKSEGISDARIYQALTAAQKAIQAGALDQAEAALRPYENRGKAFDNAQVRLQLAYVYSSQQKPEKALAELKTALDNSALTGSARQNALQNLVYLYAGTQRPDEAMTAAQAFAAAGGTVTPAIYGLLGASYAQTQNWRAAICPTYLAVSAKGEPKQSWYDVLLSAHWELKDMAGAEAVLTEAIARLPREAKNWQQLAQVYLSERKDADALALMENGYRQGIFQRESDMKNLATLYLNAGQPAKAAVFLENAITGGKLPGNEVLWKGIAQAWSQAGNLDKTIAAYGQAGQYGNAGQYAFFQGQLYAQQKQWQSAVNAFQSALKAKGLKDEGQVWLDLGIAQFHRAQFDAARASLKTAAGFPSAKREAEKMMKQVDAEG